MNNSANRLLGIVSMLLASPSLWAQPAASHCHGDEVTIFNCSVGRKVVSACSTPDNRSLFYRFGVEGAPERTLPDPKRPDRTQIDANTLTYAGGGGAYLRFTEQPYAYVLYTAIGRGWGEKAGIVVEKNGQRQAHIACKGKVESELGPDWFERAAIASAPGDFELP